MRMMRRLAIVIGFLFLAACATDATSTPASTPTPESLPPTVPQTAPTEGAPTKGAATINQSQAPPLTIDVNNQYTATINTNMGAIVLELFPKEAPNTVNSFVFLAREGFYEGVIFHRVLKDFMIQGGDPTGTGAGGPGYRLAYEIDPNLKFDKPGILAIAGTTTEASGSQFFITVAPTSWLDGNHTIFGRVLEGQEVADAISLVATRAGDRPLENVVIESIEITETSP